MEWSDTPAARVNCLHLSEFAKTIRLNEEFTFRDLPTYMIMSSDEITMCNAQFTEYQIIAFLKSVEAVWNVKDFCWGPGIYEDCYYSRKAKFGNIKVHNIIKMKGLEDEKCHLKQMFVHLSL